jgi:hypothetical protein
MMRDNSLMITGSGPPRFDQNLNHLGIHYTRSPIIIDDLSQVPKKKSTAERWMHTPLARSCTSAIVRRMRWVWPP